MIGILFAHRWKQFRRSSYLGQSIATGLVLFILGLYFLILAILLGVGMGKIMETALGDYGHHAASRFSTLLPIILFIDFCLRYFLDGLPIIQTRPYLLHAISKRFLSHFTLVSSFFSYWNIFWALVIGVFIFSTVRYEISTVHTLFWAIGWILYILISQFAGILLKRMTAFNSRLLFYVIGAIGLLVLGHYLEVYNILSIGAFLMGNMGDKVWQLAFPLAGFVGIYRLNYIFLRRNMYEDAWLQRDKTSTISGNFDFLSDRGVIGALIAQELKLILRNKRTKNILYFTFVGMLYGLVVFNDRGGGFSPMWIMGGILVTGIFLVNYGQYCFSWDSPAYDGWLVKPITSKDYVKSKWILLSGSVVVVYILTLPYLFLGRQFFWINTVFGMYNLGFTVFVLMYASTYDHKRLDLSKSNVFNYQGAGASQWVVMIPILMLPFIFIIPFTLFQITDIGLATIFILSLISFACYPLWLNGIQNNLLKKKYIKSQGYRQKANA
jgi:hypothetical protein